MPNDEIAARLNARREVVWQWRKRLCEEGLQGFEERPRRGRPGIHSSPNLRERRRRLRPSDYDASGRPNGSSCPIASHKRML